LYPLGTANPLYVNQYGTPESRPILSNIKIIAIFSLFCTIVIVLIHLIIMFYQMSECILYLQIEIYKVSGWISNVDEYIIFIS